MVGSDFATRLMARMDMALWGAVTTNVERYMGVSMQNIQRAGPVALEHFPAKWIPVRR
jgi:hypothetical protein